MCFTELNALLRTHDKSYNYKDIHLGETILTKLPNFNVITSIPYDYMHLTLIGAVKNLLCFGQLEIKIKQFQFHNIFLPSFKKNTMGVPEVILSEIQMESYRITSTYVVYWNSFISKWLINHICTQFMKLSIAMRILLTTNINAKYITFANKSLRQFVSLFNDYYGTSYV